MAKTFWLVKVYSQEFTLELNLRISSSILVRNDKAEAHLPASQSNVFESLFLQRIQHTVLENGSSAFGIAIFIDKNLQNFIYMIIRDEIP
jgi:hypothetical protein